MRSKGFLKKAVHQHSSDSLGLRSPRGSLGSRTRSAREVIAAATGTEQDQVTEDVSQNDQALEAALPTSDVRLRSGSPSSKETESKASAAQAKASPKLDSRTRSSTPPKSDTRVPPKSDSPAKLDSPSPPKRSPLGIEWRNAGSNTQSAPALQTKVDMQSPPKVEEPTATLTTSKYSLRNSPGVSPTYEWRNVMAQQQACAQSSPKIDARSPSNASPKLLSRSSSAQGVGLAPSNNSPRLISLSRSPSAQGVGPGTESRKLQTDVPDELLRPMTVLQESMQSMLGEVSQMSRSMSEFQESMFTGPMFRSIRSTIRSELEQFFKELVVEAVVPEIGKAVINCSPPPSPEGIVSRGLRTETEKTMSMTGSMKQRLLANSGQSLKADSLAVGGASTQVSRYAAASALEEPLLGKQRSPPKTSDNRKSSKSRESSGSSTMSKQNKRTSVGEHYRDHHILRQDAIAERNEIKLRLEEALAEDEFNAEDFYHQTGVFQRWARQDSTFSTISLMVIMANVIWLGIDEDLNQADVLCDAPLLSQVMNNLFCVYFLFELTVKFFAFEKKTVAFTDAFFLFDFALVVFMVWETWIEVFLYLFMGFKGQGGGKQTQLFRFLRLFRLSRIPRIVRLTAFLPELMVLMKGMVAAMRSVFAILIFIGMVIFIFAILFTELLRSTPEFKVDFANVPTSMQTLLLHVLCGVDPDFINLLLHESWVYYLLYLLFLFLGTLTLMNMMVGVLCDVVSSVSEEEKDRVALQTLELEIGDIAAMIDTDGSGTISKNEFEQLMQCKQVLKSLHSIDVDVMSFGGLTKYIYRDEDSELTFAEFCQLVAHFRGSRYATVKDLVETQKFITMEVNGVVVAIEDLMTNLLALK